jgi:hypothetical protein
MPTTLEYIHGIAQSGLFGRSERLTTTSAGSTSTLVCASLVNSVLSATEYSTWWVLIEDGACAGEVGLLKNAPLSVASGTLSTATAFSSSIASGVTFSLFDRDRLPPVRHAGKTGQLDIINQVARLLWVESDIELDGVSGQHRYAVSATQYPWWTDRERVISVSHPLVAADDLSVALNDADIDWDVNGETRQLVFRGAPFGTGDSFRIKVYRPANSRLKKNARLRANLTGTAVTSVTVLDGGDYEGTPTIAPSSGAATFTAVLTGTALTSVTVGVQGAYTATFPPALVVTRNASDTGWADQTTQTAGLVTLTDEALSDVEDVKTAFLWLAYRALAETGAPGQTQVEWLGKSSEWAGYTADLEHYGEPSNRRTNVARIRPVLVGGRRSLGYGRRGY